MKRRRDSSATRSEVVSGLAVLLVIALLTILSWWLRLDDYWKSVSWQTLLMCLGCVFAVATLLGCIVLITGMHTAIASLKPAIASLQSQSEAAGTEMKTAIASLMQSQTLLQSIAYPSQKGGSVMSLERVREFERNLINGDSVIVIAPDKDVEFPDEAEGFAMIAKSNIQKGVRYTYLLDGASAQVRGKLLELFSDYQEGDVSVFEPVKPLPQNAGLWKEMYAVLCAFTITTFACGERSARSYKVLLVAPDFEPPFALAVADTNSQRIINAVNLFIDKAKKDGFLVEARAANASVQAGGSGEDSLSKPTDGSP